LHLQKELPGLAICANAMQRSSANNQKAQGVPHGHRIKKRRIFFFLLAGAALGRRSATAACGRQPMPQQQPSSVVHELQSRAA